MYFQYNAVSLNNKLALDGPHLSHSTQTYGCGSSVQLLTSYLGVTYQGFRHPHGSLCIAGAHVSEALKHQLFAEGNFQFFSLVFLWQCDR